jgi:hypothetical protein
MYKLIAFVGFKGSGKNTAAAALLPYGFVPLSYADALKDALAAIFCWDRVLLEGVTTESREWRERIDDWWAAKLGIPGFTPRWAMRNVGTEIMRQHFNNDIWMLNVERRLLLIDAPVVLVDSRFPNEIALAHQHNGEVICIERGPNPSWMGTAITANYDPEPMQRHYALSVLAHSNVHESEFAWIGSPIDGTITNNGTVADLHAKVVERCVRSADSSR